MIVIMIIFCIIAIFIAIAIGLKIFEIYKRNGWLTGIISGIILVLIVINSSIAINNHLHKKWIIRYRAIQTVYSASLTNKNLSGMERFEIVNNIANWEASLESKRYNIEQWYEFGITNEIKNEYKELKSIL